MNHKCKTVLVSIGMLLILLVGQLWADTQSFDVTRIDPKITKIEYKIGNRSWNEVDVNFPRIEVPRSSTAEDLLIRQYSGKKMLGELFAYRYDQGQNSWVWVAPDSVISGKTMERDNDRIAVTITPFLSLLFSGATVRHVSNMHLGGGFDVSLSFPSHRDVMYSAGLEIGWAKSNNIWAESLFNYGGNIGVGYRFTLTEAFCLTPALSYGLRFHYGIDSIIDDPIFMSHIIAVNLNVGYRFTAKTHAYVAPSIQFMIDSTRNGFLFGMRAGVAFDL